MKKFLIAAAFLAACSPDPATPQPAPPQTRYYTDPPQVGYTPVVQLYDSYQSGLDRTVDVFLFTAPNGCQWLFFQGGDNGGVAEYKNPEHEQICVPRDE